MEPKNFSLCVKNLFPQHFEGDLKVISSINQLEYDINFVNTLIDITNTLPENGLFLFTCASTGFINRSGIVNKYYRVLTAEDIQKSIPIYLYYSRFYFEYDPISCELHFWGMRNATKINHNTLSLIQRQIDTMEEIFNQFPTDKGPYFHRYTRYYPAYLDKYRYLPIRILEIGVLGGNSLKASREYFKNATEIVGIDINPECKKYESSDNHVRVEIGSQDDHSFLTEVNTKYGPFDVIIDDGSHIIDHIIVSFETLFPLLNDNGTYIVEDTAVFRFIGTYRINKSTPNHLDYFAEFTSYLNQSNLQTPNYTGQYPHCSGDPDKIDRKTSDPFEYGIDSIHYGMSHIVITKKLRKNWIIC
jgi:hypothetical protein